MSALIGKKQTKEHIEKRMQAMRLCDKWPGGSPPKYTSEMLWAKVKKGVANECWHWLGYINESGYGRVWLDGKGYYAHRVIYNLAFPNTIKLKAPKSTKEYGFLRHKCDNPSCCNPSHLLIGTHFDNMRDKVERGRSRWFDSSVKSPRAKLTIDDVRSIRQKYNPKNGATRNALALLYDVSKSTIEGVIHGRHYQDIT